MKGIMGKTMFTDVSLSSIEKCSVITEVGIYTIVLFIDKTFMHQIDLHCDHREIDTYKKFKTFLRKHCCPHINSCNLQIQVDGNRYDEITINNEELFQQRIYAKSNDQLRPTLLRINVDCKFNITKWIIFSLFIVLNVIGVILIILKHNQILAIVIPIVAMIYTTILNTNIKAISR